MQEFAKSKKSIPSANDGFANDKSRKSREWKGFQQVQPIKRSDSSVLDSVSNPLFQNKVAEFNMSNALANYHNPINLMYANNLTVKNYFLMMPPCNASLGGNAAEQFLKQDEGLETKEKVEFSLKPLHQAASGANLSSSFTKETTFESQVVPTGAASSTELQVNVSSSFATDNTKEPTVCLDKTSSTNLSSQLSQSSIPNSTETTILTENTQTESNTKLSADISKMTLNSLETFISKANGKSEEIGVTTIRSETTSSTGMLGLSKTSVASSCSHSMTSQLEASASSTSTKQSTLAEHPTRSQTQTTTTLDEKASRFLQTIDKYCETFFWGDKGTYTIRPVTFAQHDNAGDNLSGKSNAKNQLSSMKDKRFLVIKNPRKNFKQIFTHPSYPL